MDDPTKNLIPRSSIEYYLRKETVSTNPDAYEAHEKFIAYLDDPEISQFGRWMCSNGINTALVAIEIDLDKIPSARPEPTFEQIEEYCQKRCLSIVDNALLHKYTCGARMEEEPHQSSDAIDVDENEWVWDKDNMMYKCTKCGFECSPKGYEDGTVDFSYNYCPHCGVKMEGKDEFH